VLGLRNDREPKFIRPFLSCKSAKIMLDPVTGVSRGYGFVRFTDEADQQRALIEMHGLYCLSRPMRISPATAKYKGPSVAPTSDMPQVQFPQQMNSGIGANMQPVPIPLPLPNSDMTRSVSVPIATTATHTSNNGVSTSTSSASIGTSISTASLTSSSSNNASVRSLGSMTTEEMMNLPNNVLAQIAQQYASGEANPPKHSGASVTQTFIPDSSLPRQASGQGESGAPRFNISEESWKHHAQARAILGNLIGPNGEQLTSTDPYNTTVFVGGLSPLISEETLRTFFAPFGD
ncbi:Protein NAM8, partial [Termitomyces sp. T112]